MSLSISYVKYIIANYARLYIRFRAFVTPDDSAQADAIQEVLKRLPERLIRQAYSPVPPESDGMVGFQGFSEAVAELFLALGSQK